MKRIWFAMALASASASAGAMEIASFLSRSAAVHDKGALMIFSAGEIRALIRELDAALGALRAKRLSAPAEGRTPAYCPPGKGKLERDEIMAALRTIPEDRRPHVVLEDALRPGSDTIRSCV